MDVKSSDNVAPTSATSWVMYNSNRSRLKFSNNENILRRRMIELRMGHQVGGLDNATKIYRIFSQSTVRFVGERSVGKLGGKRNLFLVL